MTAHGVTRRPTCVAWKSDYISILFSLTRFEALFKKNLFNARYPHTFIKPPKREKQTYKQIGQRQECDEHIRRRVQPGGPHDGHAHPQVAHQRGHAHHALRRDVRDARAVQRGGVV